MNKDQRETVPLNPQTTKPNPLPQDVAGLTAFGLGEFSIYKLMGLASKLGYRLGHVAHAALPHLQRLELHGARAFRYLQKMIERGGNYHARYEAAAHLATRERAAQLSSLCSERHLGKRFISPAGSTITICARYAEVMKSDGTILAIAGAALAKLYEDIESGVFAACQ